MLTPSLGLLAFLLAPLLCLFSLLGFLSFSFLLSFLVDEVVQPQAVPSDLNSGTPQSGHLSYHRIHRLHTSIA
jgi:hypothetical protein